ncbi:MAG: DASS family sodium-coupled anion symporter [Vicinamibacterales bacterium]
MSSEADASSAPSPLAGRAVRFLALAAVYAVVVLLVPRPDTVTVEGWRITAIFLATIAGLMIQPLPGAALVIIGLTCFVLIGGLPVPRVLTGFSSPSVWLVLAAMLMSRALRDSGLSRRIALIFVRLVGQTSLGVSYALMMSDVTLATGIPSITARSGGIILPVARSIAELYGSTPGATSRRLGAFLMTSLYQGSAVACAMFLTGQASNVLIAGLAAKLAGVTITWSSWFMAGIVPGLASCIVVPLVVMRVQTPTVRRTPAAAEFAREQLVAMGPLSRDEAVSLAVFVTVCVLWMTSAWNGLDVTIVALAALGVLIMSGVLTWDTALREKHAWDVFVWYGGLLTMGEILNETGSTTAFAEWVGASFSGMDWFAVLLLTLVIYFYAHYAFASITAHALAMFPPFVVMLIGLGTPPLVAVYALACLANLTAGLTHYGTTTAPIVFAEGYVSFADWWRAGFAVSVANLCIWVGLGLVWWKWLGFW